MADLAAVAATIQAAQIQANYALWAALVSSFLGAGGIIFAANFAFKSGLKTQQHNNILEAKREVYLDVVASGRLLISIIKRFPRVNLEYYENFTSCYDDFLSKLNKASMVCAESNRSAVSSVIEYLELVYGGLDHVFYEYQESSHRIINYKNERNDKSKAQAELICSLDKLQEHLDGLHRSKVKNIYVDTSKTGHDLLSNVDELRIASEIKSSKTIISALRRDMNVLSELIRSEEKEQNTMETRVVFSKENSFNNLEVSFDQLIKSLRGELYDEKDM